MFFLVHDTDTDGGVVEMLEENEASVIYILGALFLNGEISEKNTKILLK